MHRNRIKKDLHTKYMYIYLFVTSHDIKQSGECVPARVPMYSYIHDFTCGRWYIHTYIHTYMCTYIRVQYMYVCMYTHVSSMYSTCARYTIRVYRYSHISHTGTGGVHVYTCAHTRTHVVHTHSGVHYYLLFLHKASHTCTHVACS